MTPKPLSPAAEAFLVAVIREWNDMSEPALLRAHKAARLFDAHHAEEVRKKDGRIATLEQRLADAAREINCAGPVAHRIRVLKSEHGVLVDKLVAERDTLKAEVERLIKGLS